MKVIVGLGNPGEKYENNRHNVGQMYIDYMVRLLNGYMVKKEKNYLAIQPSSHSAMILVKPSTFMNHSGLAVKELVKQQHLTSNNLIANNLIIVHDDLDVTLGKFKIQQGVGPLLHNGIESVERALGGKDFWRVRIGVDNRMLENRLDGETYVLQNFTPEEKKLIFEVFPKIFSRLKNELLLQE